jgi:Mce-associated membrane protein
VADKTREASNETAAGTPTIADETSETVTEAETADETGVAADEKPAAADETTETTEEASKTADETTETPAGKIGETSPAAETSIDGAADADASGDAAKDAEDRRSRTRLVAVILGLITVVLAGFGVWATLEAHSLRATAAPQNLALTDGAATSAVKRQITSAINTVFSYNYADTGATRRAAQGLLTGPAIKQYNTYFALVTKDAPAQKLVVTTRVTNSGVELLTGNRARVLVFANQQDTRAGTKQTSYAGALFAVTAVHQGNRWKIENIDTFSGS